MILAHSESVLESKISSFAAFQASPPTVWLLFSIFQQPFETEVIQIEERKGHQAFNLSLQLVRDHMKQSSFAIELLLQVRPSTLRQLPQGFPSSR